MYKHKVNKMNKSLTVILTMAFLTGCEEQKHSYAYLVDHPVYLKSEFDRCQATMQASADCEAVMRVANSMATMEEEMQADPEKYGIKILNTETELGKMKVQIVAQQGVIAGLKAQGATTADMQKAQDVLDKQQKAYDEKSLGLKVMLDVVGMISPE